MKKIIFPFFNKIRHKLLVKILWFRIISILYIIILISSIFFAGIKIIITPIYNCIKIENEICSTTEQLYPKLREKYGCLSYSHNLNTYSCYNPNDYLFIWNIETFLGTFVFIVIIHYLIQLIFFKLIINYIVLGGKSIKIK